MQVRAAFVFAAASILVAACGSRSAEPATDASSPSSSEKADVTIVVEGASHACVVSLASEAQGSSIPCKEVIAFIKEQLRVASGSSYDLRLRGAEEADAVALRLSLRDAGYRPWSGRNSGAT